MSSVLKGSAEEVVDTENLVYSICQTWSKRRSHFRLIINVGQKQCPNETTNTPSYTFTKRQTSRHGYPVEDRPRLIRVRTLGPDNGKTETGLLGQGTRTGK